MCQAIGGEPGREGSGKNEEEMAVKSSQKRYRMGIDFSPLSGCVGPIGPSLKISYWEPIFEAKLLW